ncbi:MAG: hypothetical protein AB7E96_10305 [Deferribacterales bacterium]
MFNKFSLFVLSVLFILLAGCASTEIYNNSQQSIARTNESLRMQKSGPDVSSLGQYAASEGGKYYFNLVNAYVSDPLTIPAIEADPATNEKAAYISEKTVEFTKKAMKKSVKEGKSTNNFAMQVIKEAEAAANNPIRIFTNPPAGAEYGYVKFRKGYDQQYVKSEDSYDLFIDFPTNSLEEADKLKEQTMAYFDEFITKENTWKKDTKVGKDSTENAIKSIKASRDTIAKYSKAADKEKTLKELDASIAGLQKQIDEDKFPNVCVYSYSWKAGNNLNTISFNLSTDETGLHLSGMTWINK